MFFSTGKIQAVSLKLVNVSVSIDIHQLNLSILCEATLFGAHL